MLLASRVLAALVLLVSVAAEAGHAAPAASLGRVSFEVTGNAEGRAHFLRGLLALHSFWYEEALDEFRAARRADPRLFMAYWGEALSYYHPVWEQQDAAKLRAALANIPADAPLTPRERAYVDAARALYLDGDDRARSRAYVAAMAEVHRAYPKDDEATTLYSVALLGAVDRKDPSFRARAEAAALSLEVFARNPSHPGAAHYIIHAFDDPEHAILALPAARRYADIAPDAYHARHMPAHIFVQLGLWPQAIASCESAWAASQAWIDRQRLDASARDYHSLSWLYSLYLEQGRRRRAEETLALARESLAQAHVNQGRVRSTYLHMIGEQLVDSGEWSRLDALLAPLAQPRVAMTAPSSGAERPAACEAHAVDPQDGVFEQASIVVLRARAAAARNDAAEVERRAGELGSLRKRMKPEDADDWRSNELEVSALLSELRGKADDAVNQLRKAAELDERSPPSGPAGEPTMRERLAALLLNSNHPAEAYKEFLRSLERHPNRARALLGAARAATAAGDQAAARRHYAQLATVWEQADPETPGFAEVRAATAAR